MGAQGHGPIWLINPPSPPGRTANREGFGGLGVVTAGRGGFVYPPLRLAEAAARAESRGLEYRVFDEVARPRILTWLTKAVAGSPGAMIVLVSRSSAESDRAHVARLAAQWPRVPIVVTGVGLHPLAPDWHELGREVRVHAAPTGFAAIDWLERSPSCDPTGPDPFASPETWLRPSWRRIPLGRKPRPGLYHARGCELSCLYCPYVIATRRTHLVRDPHDTATEFEDLARRWRPRRIVFRDPVFGFDSGSTLRLLERLEATAPAGRAPFEIESRAEILAEPEAILPRLARAGCVEIKLGVETVEAEPLERSARLEGDRLGVRYAGGRGARSSASRYADLNREVIGRARALGIDVRVFLMRGLPGQSSPRPTSELVAEGTWIVEKDLVELPEDLR